MILVYDESCSLCVNFKNFVVKADREGRVSLMALGDPRVDDLLPRMSATVRQASFHLVFADGRITSGADAIPDVLRLLPGGGIPAWCLEHVPGFSRFNTWLYRVIATHR